MTDSHVIGSFKKGAIVEAPPVPGHTYLLICENVDCNPAWPAIESAERRAIEFRSRHSTLDIPEEIIHATRVSVRNSVYTKHRMVDEDTARCQVCHRDRRYGGNSSWVD